MNALLITAFVSLIMVILLQAAWMDGARATAPPNGHNDSGFEEVLVLLWVLAVVAALIYVIVG